MSGYDDALDELMAAPAAQFVARRKELARGLHETGHREDAARLLAVRKPNAALSAANQVARYDPDALELLLDAAETVRRMQGEALAGKGTGPADLRSAFAAFQQALDRVARRAARVSNAGTGQEAARRRRDLLQAAALGADESREALARGRLIEEPPPIGSGGLTSDPRAAVDAPRPRPQRTQAGARRQARAEAAAAERPARRLSAAKARAAGAQTQADQAESRAARLEAKADLADEEARRLRQQAKAARGVAAQRRREARSLGAEA